MVKQISKRVFCLFMAVVFSAALMPVWTASAEIVDSGTCGENLTWTLDSEGTLTISGTGDMENYYNRSPWYKYNYNNSIRSAVIGEGVTRIGENAFEECRGLTSITIPSSVTRIGDGAFRRCSGLTNITIPSSVTSIGNTAFWECSGLTSINVDSQNEYYKSIDGVLFDYDTTLLHTYPAGKTQASYTIPSSVTSIGNGAFWGCSSLTSITIPSSVTSINSHAFGECSGLTSITIPSGVTSINSHAFFCSGLTSITIPSSVTSINSLAFWGCSGLTSITIPSSVTSIGDSAFDECRGLTSITIPSSVTSIGGYAFLGCRSLTDVYYSGTETQWNNISIGSYNNPLKNAAKHYNQPIPTPHPPVSLAVSVLSAGALSVDIDTPADAYILVAQYDKARNMLSVTKEQTFAEKTDTVYNVKIPSFKCAYIKIMLWDGLSSVYPLSEALLIDMDK